MKKVSLLLAAATASFMIVSGAPHIVLTEDAALTANPTIVGNSCSRSCEDTYRACTDSASKCITTYLSCQNTCKSTAEVAVPAPVLAATKDCRTCYASCYRNTACIAECVRVCAAEKPNGLSQSKPAPALGYGSVDCQSCSNSYGGCSSSCSPGDASCLGSCIDSFLGCMNQCDDSVSVSVAPATVGLSACQAACKLTADAAKALCKFKRKDRREHCEWQVAQALDVCNTACDLKVDMPAPVTPMMPRDCREACHANEYEQITACGQSGDCVHQIESAIADCDAQCDNPHEEVEASVESSSSQPVGGVACVAACKLASKAASAACKFQKPSHRERCKQNVAKVETDCEAACVLIPTVKATEATEEETKASQQHATLGAPAFTLAESEYQKHFTSFVQKHGKKYTRDEFFPRYTIFKANLNKIHAHNAKNLPYTMAVNEFADMTFTEFHAKMTGYKRMTKSDRSAASRATNGPHTKLGRSQLASSVDWRQKNAVTPVKNQQQCGSCWAFSTTGATEGAHAIKTGNLVSLSEQQLVDCSAAQGNQGCNGGMMDQGFQYIITNGGITTEDAYPYTASQGTCQSNTTVAATLSSFVDVTPGSETALMQAVNLGPVSVAIEADQQCFQFYSGGVLSDPSCGTNLDHGVLVVGYGTDNTVSPPANYWIVKNSWGESWGENGYIRLARGSNECGIATEPSYPVV